METETKLKASDLDGFTGTSQYHQNFLGILFTDGVHYLAEKGGAYWLIDAIASHQPEAMKDPMLSAIQFWELTVKDKTATLTCSRDRGDVAITQEIPYTDFPLEMVKLYLSNNVLMLPSEY